MNDGRTNGHNRSKIIASQVRVRTLVRPETDDSLSSIAVIALKIARFVAKARRHKNL